MESVWWAVLAGGTIAGLVVILWQPVRASLRKARFARVRRDFHVQRERLEVKFVSLISAGNRSNEDDWVDCEFDDDVAYVRDRSTGQLSAFVAVTVSSEEAGDATFPNGEAVGNLRAGTAVFRFDHDHWETDGRTIRDLSPAEAISFYHDDFEVVQREMARR